MGPRGACTRTGSLAAALALSALLVSAAPAWAQTTTSSSGLASPSSSTSTSSTTSTTSASTTTTTTVAPPTATTAPSATSEPRAALVAPAASGFTVTPSTGLGYRQPVTVTGSGFPPDTGVVFSQCAAGATSAADCGGGTGFAVTDAAGGFSTPFTVRRLLATSSRGEVDCASAPGACIVGGAALPGYTDGTSAPLEFDPNAPIPPPPLLVATPTVGLGLETEVRAAAMNLVPGDLALFSVCVRGSTSRDDCWHLQIGQADGSGIVSVTLRVTRGIRTPNDPEIDCASAPGCDLVVWGFPDAGSRGSTPLLFDPSVPIPPPPDVVVTPSVGLADRQQVRIAATGFRPGAFVYLGQCRAESTDGSTCGAVQLGVADEQGAVEATIQVRRFVGFGPMGVDCQSAPGACVAFATDVEDVFAHGSVPLTFDPNAPPVPPPAVSAAPTTGLVDGSVITVTGSGFAPNEQVAVIQCINDPHQDDSGRGCDLSGTLRYLSADAAGNVTAAVTVRRTLTTQGYGTVDCATAPQGCILGWAGVNDIQNQRGNVVLSFVAGEPGTPGGDPGAPGGQQLAFTGSSSGRLAGLGVGALVVGVALVAVTRARRRRAPSPG